MSALPRNVRSSKDLHGVRWLRSSYSTGANNCVETARPASGPCAGLLAVRDSKDPAGPALLFSPASWTRFTAAVHRM
ncbi:MULTISPECIES: DUF397 domain-containing protein [Streptomyces]|jgi:hypothetical protein|uniref:DUF397 domain-containing protein n=1 Tax=Streptomyces thermoviolaceus subsp. thermoviolaceus TaxID=66860 RepID=A0ABX0YUJ9_STRTL|nr:MULTISPECIES: DUF397 domain-containing protein [Streptomyces]MCM3262763.1 DUF397 domain-containing protein [Streptomyces thermoviolaceus]NJP14809.1 DUF397 domain-containing protein [Streptomyces thermoviolaceus subsp. thermoviolaceus]RSS01256.1 DUF397 domain-containing protein [Streptomyces sp. WAC00469]WTD50186.1 DUF397 domain-containing protein [Streptomyces thermoviolaceus]GGV64690.1 DUF397 domain-containing protein [Streptomyces thermoviolaceus subsp. apingens]